MTDDRGVAAAIVLFPMFAAVVFMFVNGAMWQLDRQVATAAADRASQAVALHGSSVGRGAERRRRADGSSRHRRHLGQHLARRRLHDGVRVGQVAGIAVGDDGHGERDIGDPDRGTRLTCGDAWRASPAGCAAIGAAPPTSPR